MRVAPPLTTAGAMLTTNITAVSAIENAIFALSSIPMASVILSIPPLSCIIIMASIAVAATISGAAAAPPEITPTMAATTMVNATPIQPKTFPTMVPALSLWLIFKAFLSFSKVLLFFSSFSSDLVLICPSTVFIRDSPNFFCKPYSKVIKSAGLIFTGAGSLGPPPTGGVG